MGQTNTLENEEEEMLGKNLLNYDLTESKNKFYNYIYLYI